MSWEERHANTAHTLESSIDLIQPGQHLFVGSGAATPRALVGALVARPERFADNQIGHILTLGEAPYVEARFAGQFRHNAYFIGPNTRDAVRAGRADYTPVFLSQIPDLMRRRRLPVDVALIQTTAPDEHGFVNLGPSVDVVLAAVQTASLVIAEINPKLPTIHGDGYVHMDDIDAWILHESSIPCMPPRAVDEAAREIGRHVASLVDDGSTIQAGIGQIPDATLTALASKKDLGVWTEMLSDGVIELVRAGVVTGKHKTVDQGRLSASFAFGSAGTYEFLHDNPGVLFHPSDVINDPFRISQQHKMVAINTALEVDLTGQVCADSLGDQFYSGIGGQVDFVRGAAMCKGGRAIIALRSTAKSGQVSRIVARLSSGAGVVTSRGDVHYVVTEYGIADLHGRSVRERAMALISIAHPDFRTELLGSAKAMHYVFQDQRCPLPPGSHPDPEHHEWSHPEFGRLRVRPIRCTDEQKMTDLFHDLSEETVRHRWLASLRAMPHAELQRYLTTDGVKNVALIVETVPKADEESCLLGVARFCGTPGGWAEMAIVVGDRWQGSGIGRVLLQELTKVARQQGVRGFVSEAMRTNTALLRLLETVGHPRQQADGDTMRLAISLAAD